MKTENDKQIDEAMTFLTNYKRYFQLDDDDVQELIIKFYSSYDKDKGAVSTFLKTMITNYNASKWRKQASAKHAHTRIQIDAVSEEDDREWLMAKIASNEPFEFITEEVIAMDYQLLSKLMECLNTRQRFIIEEHYINEKSIKELSEELGTSHQYISEVRKIALEKMKNNSNNTRFFGNF